MFQQRWTRRKALLGLYSLRIFKAFEIREVKMRYV
jgi:hypothetical protein